MLKMQETQSSVFTVKTEHCRAHLQTAKVVSFITFLSTVNA